MAHYWTIIVLNTFYLFLSVYAQVEDNKSVIVDISQVVKDVLRNDTMAKCALENILKDTMKMSNAPLMYYQTDLSDTLLVELQDVFNVFHKANRKLPGLEPKLLFSINEIHELDDKLNISLYIRQHYASILDLFLDQSYIVSGVSINAIWLESHCYTQGENYTPHLPIQTIIAEIRNLITTSNHFNQSEMRNNLKIGYETHIDSYINCKDYLYNGHNADFVVLSIPLTRKHNLVESHSALVKNIFQDPGMIGAQKRFVDKGLYVRISLNAFVDRGTLKSYYSYKWAGFGAKVYNKDEDRWLESVKGSLQTVDEKYSRRYETLLTTYAQEWTKYGEGRIIVSYSHGYPFFNKTQFFENSGKNNEIIPYITNLPTRGVNDQDLDAENSLTIDYLEEMAEIFLQDVGSAGFKTVMIADTMWDTLANRIDTNNTFFDCQSTATCESMNVIYLVDDDKNINSLLTHGKVVPQIGELNVNTVVFSDKLQDVKVRDLNRVVETFNKENLNVTYGCQIRTDVFGRYGDHVYCENTNVCKAIDFRRAFGMRCLPIQNITSIVIWVVRLGFEKLEQNDYRTDYFIETIMERLDSFVIGREIILREFPTQKIILQFQSDYAGDSSWTGSLTLYCNSVAEKIDQFYETILTWAKIHDFPVILQPALDSQFRYDNPLAWKQLEVTSSTTLHKVMKAAPLFIRRSYNKSKVSGSWTSGMYPCISKATTTTKVNLDNDYSGVTLNLRLHQGHHLLRPDELQTLLLFALKKFSSVEIFFSQGEDISVLKEIVLQLKDNLKINQINGKTVYLRLPDQCSEENVGILNQVMSGFHNAGVHVNVHAQNHKCLKDIRSGKVIGLEVNNCSAEIKNLVLLYETEMMANNSHFAEISYIVCQTETVLADNTNEKNMQDYLDSHLYMKKVFQNLYPNLERIHFRLQPKWTDGTPKNQISNLMMFLSDVNNYAKGYNVHYFILPAFSTENNDQTEASFWKITNYRNLTDLSVYLEYQSELFNETTRLPKVAKFVDIEKQEDGEGEVEIPENANAPLEEENVESLENETTTLIPTLEEDSNEREIFELLYTTVGPALLLVIILILALILWRRKFIRLSKQEIQQFYRGHQVTLKKAVDERRQSQYTVNIFAGLVFQKDYEFPKKDVALNKKVILGKGRISIVYPANVKNTGKCIAVKVVNKNCTNAAFKEMLGEVKLLCYIGDHMNVVKFLGCYTKEIRNGVLWMFTEFCEGGSLQTFLRRNKYKNSIDTKDMIKFALEIASGMEYISSQKIIHGNLCTSNVLLDGKHKNCKVYGCGGLSRRMRDQQKCVKKNNEPSKWQWMAHESMKCMTYSMASDVWSFGVTVWEIFTLGDIPFSEMPWDAKFVDDLEKGTRLEMPLRLSSKKTYDVMMKCWNMEVEMRPDFSELVHHFSNLLRK